MTVRSYQAESSADTALVTTAETVVATLPGITTYQAGVTVRLRALAQLTTGTGTTAVTPRIRRDGLTGTVVNEANPITVGAAAGSTEDFEVECDDSFSAEVANQTYVLTLQQTGASANGSCLYSNITADVG